MEFINFYNGCIAYIVNFIFLLFQRFGGFFEHVGVNADLLFSCRTSEGLEVSWGRIIWEEEVRCGR